MAASLDQPDLDVDLFEHAFAGGGIERAVQLQGEVAVMDREARDLREPDDMHPRLAHQGQLPVLAVLDRLRGATAAVELGVGLVDDMLDHRDPSADHPAACIDRDLVATQRVEQLRERAAAGRQRGHREVGPGLGIERHRHADRLAVLVDHGEALEQIVDLILAHTQAQQLAVDHPGALEVADAVAVEHDRVQGQAVVGDRGIGRTTRASEQEGEREGQSEATQGSHDDPRYPEVARGASFRLKRPVADYFLLAAR